MKFSPLTALRGKKINYLALAFVCPFLALLLNIIIRGAAPFGDSSMLYSDCYHQYYPFFLAFRKAIVSGDGLLYTWSVGMGMDYLGLIAYYLASPLNLLSVLLPESMALGYFALLVPIKLSLASLFFAIFLKKTFGKDDISLVLFGAFYGLCAWALAYQWNIMWLDTFALLPLVTLGTISLLRDKKFVLYTVTLFLSIAANYYIGFFTCIFVFLVFICYQVCCCKSFKQFMLDLCRIAVFSVIAICMTAFLTLPAFQALQTTQSSVNKFPTTFRLNIAKEHNLLGLLKGMFQVATNMSGGLMPSFKEGLPNLYCGIGSLMLAFVFLTDKQVRLRERLCCLVLLLFFIASFLIRQLDYIWHGFHFTNMIPYRFSFLYSFVMLYMAYRAYLNRDRMKVGTLILGLIISGVLMVSSDYADKESYIAFNIVFVVLYMAALIYCTVKHKEPKKPTKKKMEEHLTRKNNHKQVSTAILAAVMALELIANVANWSSKFPSTGISNYPKGTDDAESAINYMFEREAGNLFFRAETTHSQTLNDGALNGYHGISAFTSSANVKTTEFIQALGYGAKNTYNRYCYEESSPVSNLFLGIKYMIERDRVKSNIYFEPIYTFGSVTLLENRAYLPLGFLANAALAEVDFAAGADFAFQNRLLAAASGVTENVWYTLPGSALTISGFNASLGNISDSGYCSYSTTGTAGTVTYTYNIDRAGLLCLDFEMPKRNGITVSVNSVEVLTETYSIPQMLSICDVAPGDVVEVKLKCKTDENGTLNIQAAVLNEDVFRQAYDVLAASAMELTEFRSTYVSGTIRCNRDGLLYTSIPQNGNWTVTVDGKETTALLVGNCMIGVPLSEGEHTVEFRYRNSAFTAGLLVTLASTAVLAALYVLVYKPKPPKGKYLK